MMADSPYDLRIALENKAYSIYYLFFDTIIFCGMFGMQPLSVPFRFQKHIFMIITPDVCGIWYFIREKEII